MQIDPLDDDLKRIAQDAAVIVREQLGITPEDAFEIIMEGILDVPRQMQFFLDSIVAMQKDWPMPRESWEIFVKSIEYTNKKHGINLVITPELME